MILKWILGPQLVAILMLSAGYLQKVYPPKDINGIYGYRTPASMKNQQAFDEGNRYSAKILLRMGSIALIIGLLTASLIDSAHIIITAILTVATAIAIPVTVILLTEKHLKQMPDRNKHEIL